MNALINEMQRRITALEGQLDRMQQQLTAATQAAAHAWMVPYSPSTAGNSNALWCRTPGSVSAATGTWPNITPATFTADVYVKLGSSSTLVSASATIRWPFKDTEVVNKLVPVVANDDGTYDAIASSCTAV